MLPSHLKIFLLGAESDTGLCDEIMSRAKNANIEILAGKLSFLQSAALMKTTVMNYVNDSAPLHFASAMNAPVTSIFCSTVPEFGFGPLSEKSFIVQTIEYLSCKPCTLHGRKACPLAHFKCAHTIQTEQLLQPLNS
jgi:heptosyltransferase-2